MALQAFLIGIIGICATFEWALGTNMGSRPIITGVFVGLALGNLKAGIMMGAVLELVFIGTVTMGAAVPPDAVTGGILGTALAISTGTGAGLALILAYPIARLYLYADNYLTLHLFPVFLNKADAYVEKGNFKGMERIHFLSGFLIKSLPRGIVCGTVYYLGTPVIRQLLDRLPDFAGEGLNVAMGFIPAVGIALLAAMTLTKKTAVYFILGFAVSAYLKIPVTGTAVLAICMAAVLVQINASAQAKVEEEEEDDF